MCYNIRSKSCFARVFIYEIIYAADKKEIAMKILIIRHGEPNYEIDGLTEKGKIEAELLSKRLIKENFAKIYCSPLGRARLTAKPTLDKLGMDAEICDWLEEFDAPVKLPYFDRPNCPWDLRPAFANAQDGLYLPDGWMNVTHIKNSNAYQRYAEVCESFDKTLEKHGYRRNGYIYEAVRPNHDTVAFFCHYGLTCVLLSHLMNCSPYSLWQHICTAPTAVTTIYTEEREAGIAHFRAASIGDISHLYVAGEEPSFAARFCECYTDNTRHD